MGCGIPCGDPSDEGPEVLIQGIPLDTFVPSPTARQSVRDELGIPSDAVVACTVANLRSQKDYPNLLQACRIAIDQVPNLYVFGSRAGATRSGELRALPLNSVWVTVSNCSAIERMRPSILAASDLFVMASEHEGYPIRGDGGGSPRGTAGGRHIPSAGIPDAIRPGARASSSLPRTPRPLAGALVEVAGDAGLRRDGWAKQREAASRATTSGSQWSAGPRSRSLLRGAGSLGRQPPEVVRRSAHGRSCRDHPSPCRPQPGGKHPRNALPPPPGRTHPVRDIGRWLLAVGAVPDRSPAGLSAAARAGASPAGTSRASRSWRPTSRQPRMSLSAIGSPVAAASIPDRENPSR